MLSPSFSVEIFSRGHSEALHCRLTIVRINSNEGTRRHGRLLIAKLSPVQNEGFGASQYPGFVIDPFDDYIKEEQAIDRANDLEDVVLGGHTEQQVAKSRRLDQQSSPPYLVIENRIVRFDRDFRFGNLGPGDRRVMAAFQLPYPTVDRLENRMHLAHDYSRLQSDNSSKSYHRHSRRITESVWFIAAQRSLVRMPTLMYFRLSNRSTNVIG